MQAQNKCLILNMFLLLSAPKQPSSPICIAIIKTLFSLKVFVLLCLRVCAHGRSPHFPSLSRVQEIILWRNVNTFAVPRTSLLRTSQERIYIPRKLSCFLSSSSPLISPLCLYTAFSLSPHYSWRKFSITMQLSLGGGWGGGIHLCQQKISLYPDFVGEKGESGGGTTCMENSIFPFPTMILPPESPFL